MNILFVTRWYPTQDNPVGGSFIQEQVSALRDKGHQVSVLYVRILDRSQVLKKKQCKIEIVDGVPVGYVSGFSIRRALFKYNPFVLYKDLQSQLKFLIDEYGPFDLIHAHVFFPSGIIATLIKEQLKLPLVVTEHFSQVHNLSYTKDKNPRMNKYLQKTVDESDAFVCVSESLRESLIKTVESNKPIQVVPNVLNETFRPLAKKSKHQFYNFVTIGNLYPVKNHILQLKAMLEMPQDAHLTIIGEGYMRTELEKFIQNNGLEDKVDLIGRVSRDRVAEILRNADAYLMTSFHETFCVAIIEALASGIPVISTYSGGPDRIIQDSYGALGLENATPGELASLMKQVMKTDYDAVKISKQVRNKYGAEQFVKEIEKVYKTAFENFACNNIT